MLLLPAAGGFCCLSHTTRAKFVRQPLLAPVHLLSFGCGFPDHALITQHMHKCWQGTVCQATGEAVASCLLQPEVAHIHSMYQRDEHLHTLSQEISVCDTRCQDILCVNVRLHTHTPWHCHRRYLEYLVCIVTAFCVPPTGSVQRTCSPLFKLPCRVPVCCVAATAAAPAAAAHTHQGSRPLDLGC